MLGMTIRHFLLLAATSPTRLLPIAYRLSPIAYRHHDSLQRHLKALPPALLPWVGVEDALARQPPVAPLVDVVLDLGFGVPGSGSGFGVRGMAHSI